MKDDVGTDETIVPLIFSGKDISANTFVHGYHGVNQGGAVGSNEFCASRANLCLSVYLPLGRENRNVIGVKGESTCPRERRNADRGQLGC